MAVKGLSRWENLKKRFYTTIEKEIVEIKENLQGCTGMRFRIGINFIPTLVLDLSWPFYWRRYSESIGQCYVPAW